MNASKEKLIYQLNTRTRSSIIPACKLEQFRSNLDKFNAQISKLGVETKANIVSTSTLYEISECGRNGTPQKHIAVEVTYTFPILELDEWIFIAKKELVDGQYIINSAIEGEIPSEYVNNSSFCDHCNSNRSRNLLFVIKNSLTGKYKQVGSSCLKEFMPNYKVAVPFFKGASLFDSYDYAFLGGEKDTALDANLIVRLAVSEIQKNGYTKVSEEYTYGGVYSTATKVKALYVDDKNAEVEVNDELLELVKAHMAESHVNAKSIFSLGYLLDNRSVYNTFIGAIYFSLVCVMRDLEKKANAKKGFFSEAGNKETVCAEYMGATGYKGNYGWVSIYKFVTECGKLLVWKTTSGDNYEIGKKYTIICKVKAHTTYMENDQTIIERCKVSPA